MSTVDDLTTLSLKSLQTQAAVVSEMMQPRVELKDGSLGYRLGIETTITLKWGNDPFDPNAPEETITLVAPDSEVRFHDPVMTLDGSLRYELETISYVAEGTSETLWPGEKVRIYVGRGVDPMLRATYGRFEITAAELGKTPVQSTQDVFLVLETPEGRLQNRASAKMAASITAVPPVGDSYVQQGIVPLEDERGRVVCSKTATVSTIVEFLGERAAQ